MFNLLESLKSNMSVYEIETDVYEPNGIIQVFINSELVFYFKAIPMNSDDDYLLQCESIDLNSTIFHVYNAMGTLTETVLNYPDENELMKVINKIVDNHLMD